MSWAFFIGAYSLLWILNITYLSANAWGFTVIVDTAFIALYWFEYFVQNKMIIFFFSLEMFLILNYMAVCLKIWALYRN